jgi:hypothetical protein
MGCVSYPSHQGGRASQQWGNTVVHGAYGLLLPPPPSTKVPTVSDETVEPVAEPVPPPTTAKRDGSTDISIDAVISLRSWLLRIVARITINRR